MIANPMYTGIPVLILNALVTYIYYAYFAKTTFLEYLRSAPGNYT